MLSEELGPHLVCPSCATIGTLSLEASVARIATRFGAEQSRVARKGLQQLDATRNRNTIRKATPRAKAMRKRAAATRVARTQAEDGGNGGADYAPGLAF